MYNHLYAYEVLMQERQRQMDRVLGQAPTTIRPLRRRRHANKRRNERA